MYMNGYKIKRQQYDILLACYFIKKVCLISYIVNTNYQKCFIMFINAIRL